MRINTIDNTNFGMSFKINPKLSKDIAKQGENFVSDLNKYGESISDVKFYHVVLDENLHTPKILSDRQNITKDFFKELKNEENNLGKWYEVPAGPDGDTASGFNPDEPKVFRELFGNKAKEKYSEFKKLNLYEQAAEYSRMLEENYIQKIIAKQKAKSEKLAEEIQRNEQQKKLNQAVDNLVERYKYEKPIEQTSVNPKKSWWQKIFG